MESCPFSFFLYKFVLLSPRDSVLLWKEGRREGLPLSASRACGSDSDSAPPSLALPWHAFPWNDLPWSFEW